MEELTPQEREAFSKLSTQTFNMENQKSKTMKNLTSRGLITPESKPAGIRLAYRIAASIALLAAGYLLGSTGLFTTTQSTPHMNKYALFLYENQEFTVTDGNRLVQEYTDWAAKLASQNKLAYAEKLNDNEKQWLGSATVENSTSKLTGYFVFYADNMGEARKIADTHPHTKYGGGLELRPIDDLR